MKHNIYIEAFASTTTQHPGIYDSRPKPATVCCWHCSVERRSFVRSDRRNSLVARSPSFHRRAAVAADWQTATSANSRAGESWTDAIVAETAVVAGTWATSARQDCKCDCVDAAASSERSCDAPPLWSVRCL